MFKSTLLNSRICHVVSKLGHTDQIAIGDAGLPIPHNTERIDLAVTEGIPCFLDVLRTMLSVMKVERIILANEIKERNKTIYAETLALIEEFCPDAQVVYCSHIAFKKMTEENRCKAVIRTGECTPFSNIILESGVIF